MLAFATGKILVISTLAWFHHVAIQLQALLSIKATWLIRIFAEARSAWQLIFQPRRRDQRLIPSRDFLINYVPWRMIWVRTGNGFWSLLQHLHFHNSHRYSDSTVSLVLFRVGDFEDSLAQLKRSTSARFIISRWFHSFRVSQFPMDFHEFSGSLCWYILRPLLGPGGIAGGTCISANLGGEGY